MLIAINSPILMQGLLGSSGDAAAGVWGLTFASWLQGLAAPVTCACSWPSSRTCWFNCPWYT